MSDESRKADLSARLARIFSQCLEPIFVVSQETGHFVYATEGALRDTGYSLDELCQMTPVELQPGATISSAIARAMPLVSGDREVVVFETSYRRKDGTVYPVEHRLQYLRSETPPAFLIIARDLSNRRDVQSMHQEDPDAFRQILEGAEAGVWLIDANAVTTFVNSKLAQLKGYSVEEMIGRHLSEFLEPDQEAYSERTIQDLKDDIPSQQEAQIRRKDGSRFWALVESSPVHDAEGNYAGAVAFISDITARKNAEAALQEQERELESRLQAVEQRLGEYYVSLETAREEVLPSAGLIERAAKQFAVLSDPKRLRILNEILVRQELTVTALADLVGMNQSNVSKHLRMLTEAGILSRRQSGRAIYYALNDPTVISLCEIVRQRLEFRAMAELDALKP